MLLKRSLVLFKPSSRSIVRRKKCFSKRNNYLLTIIVIAFFFACYLCIIAQRQQLIFGFRTDTNIIGKMLTFQGDGSVNDNYNDIQYFSPESENMKMPSHLDQVDPSLIKPCGFTTIDKVHLEGKIHIGSWIYVVFDSSFNIDNDTSQDDLELDHLKVLILKRGEQLITCPSTWSLLGEHTFRDEQPLETARRGIMEELGHPTLRYVEKHGKISNLTKYPVYYERDYGSSNEGRIDRQLTYLWLVEMNAQTVSDVGTIKEKKHDNLSIIDDMLQLDDEVVDHKWIPFRDFSNLLKKEKDPDDDDSEQVEDSFFCHPTIISLSQFGFEKILQTMRERKNTNIKM